MDTAQTLLKFNTRAGDDPGALTHPGDGPDNRSFYELVDLDRRGLI
jgi:hypothetical protein